MNARSRSRSRPARRASLRAAVAALLSLAATAARAAPTTYSVRLPPDGLVVEIPYSLGTHHEHVTAVDGVLRADPETLRVERGRLTVPLSAFRSDDAKRGCHLREALGLDYTRSQYPREHVCDDQNRLPASGPDAIAFPEIAVDLDGGSGATGDGAGSAVDVDATLTVHGVPRPLKFRVTVSRDDAAPGLLRVRGRVPVRLASHGVQVKPAKVLFASISVGDTVTVVLDVRLEPVRAGGS
ncbi:MAG TPA: YceI family protein [Anaeromyxobacteraceae bacterium]|nr:YceI family protein [Anaeromyxobacteraceae bacterium]